MKQPRHSSRFYAHGSALLAVMTILVVSSQSRAEEKAPDGIAAQLTVSSGKKISVRLLDLKDNQVTFKTRSKETTVPTQKVASLNFSLNKKDFDFFTEQKVISNEEVKEIFKNPNVNKREKLNLIFDRVLENVSSEYNQGNYPAVIASMGAFLTEFTPYMQIDNNLQETFLLLTESYRKLGNVSKAEQCLAPLLHSKNKSIVLRAQVNQTLIEISKGDLKQAEARLGEIKNKAAALYLEAQIKRAQGNPQAAILLVTSIIAEYSNDIEWMAPSELLSAQLYQDMVSTNSVGITTNSAINTSRQVKNIYAGSAVAADARIFWASLGGEAIEAKENKIKADQKRRRKEQEAKVQALRDEAEAKRLADEAAMATNHVDVTTSEIESE